MIKTFATAALVAMLAASSAFAQTAAPATPAAPAAPAADAPATDAPAAAPMDKKAKSKDCYAQATTQGLHGKARKHFHSKCMKGAM